MWENHSVLTLILLASIERLDKIIFTSTWHFLNDHFLYLMSPNQIMVQGWEYALSLPFNFKMSTLMADFNLHMFHLYMQQKYFFLNSDIVFVAGVFTSQFYCPSWSSGVFQNLWDIPWFLLSFFNGIVLIIAFLICSIFEEREFWLRITNSLPFYVPILAPWYIYVCIAFLTWHFSSFIMDFQRRY